GLHFAEDIRVRLAERDADRDLGVLLVEPDEHRGVFVPRPVEDGQCSGGFGGQGGGGGGLRLLLPATGQHHQRGEGDRKGPTTEVLLHGWFPRWGDAATVTISAVAPQAAFIRG